MTCHPVYQTMPTVAFWFYCVVPIISAGKTQQMYINIQCICRGVAQWGNNIYHYSMWWACHAGSSDVGFLFFRGCLSCVAMMENYERCRVHTNNHVQNFTLNHCWCTQIPLCGNRISPHRLLCFPPQCFSKLIASLHYALI